MTTKTNSTVIVIGATGSGKSTFCNVMAGKRANDRLFPVGHVDSRTTTTTSNKVNWMGNDFEMNLIDTPGMQDSELEDFKHIQGMIDELKKHEKIDAFILVINAADLMAQQFDTNLITNVIVAFKLSYGIEFLQNTIVEVNRWSYSAADIVTRKRNKITEVDATKRINDAIRKGNWKIVHKYQLKNRRLNSHKKFYGKNCTYYSLLNKVPYPHH